MNGLTISALADLFPPSALVAACPAVNAALKAVVKIVLLIPIKGGKVLLPTT